MADLKITRAELKDSESLKILYSEGGLGNTAELRALRRGTYFDQYRLQSDDFDTFLLKDEAMGGLGVVEGTGTLIFRSGLVDHSPQVIGYATDLRISNKREAIQSWAQHFLPVLERSKTERGCKYMFSVVPGDQSPAFNALTRPRSARRNLPRFHLVRKFETILVHGRSPFYNPLKTLTLRTAQEQDIPQLVNYLIRQTQNRPLAFSYSPDLLSFRLRRWHGLQIEHFVLAFDAEKNLVGCVAPWDSSMVQSYEIIQYRKLPSAFKLVSRVGSFFDWTRSLPEIQKKTRFMYLTHFHADNPDIFETLIDRCYVLWPSSSFFVYPHFEGATLTIPPRKFLTTSHPFALYCLLSPGDTVPSFLNSNLMSPPPELELCLV